jgi:putative phage-type endonuclease
MKKETVNKLPEGLPSNLEYYPLVTHSEEWHSFRRNGIGGSEVGYIMGLSPYKSSIQLFYEKIGEHEPSREQNEAMFHGTHLESYVANLWKYYDGTKTGYIENFNQNNIIRDLFVVDGYIRNPKYPHLFANVDGIMPIGSVSLATSEVLEKNGLLEIKTIGSFYAKVWDDGIPPQYLAQVHQYMMILELDYCEIAMLIDGKFFEVHIVERSQRLCDQIEQMTLEFWEDRVVPAKELLEKKKEHDKAKRYDLAEEAEGGVHMLEPEADNSEAYKEFMQRKQLLDPIIIEGTQEMKENLIKHKYWGAIEKTSKKMKTLYENKSRKILMDANSDKMTFGDEEGYVDLSKRKGSDKLILGNRIKTKVDLDIVNDILEDVDEKL